MRERRTTPILPLRKLALIHHLGVAPPLPNHNQHHGMAKVPAWSSRTQCARKGWKTNRQLEEHSFRNMRPACGVKEPSGKGLQRTCPCNSASVVSCGTRETRHSSCKCQASGDTTSPRPPSRRHACAVPTSKGRRSGTSAPAIDNVGRQRTPRQQKSPATGQGGPVSALGCLVRRWRPLIPRMFRSSRMCVTQA